MWNIIRLSIGIVLLWVSIDKSKANHEKKEHSHSHYQHSVKVYHFMIGHWGESRTGLQHCGNIACDWTHADQIGTLKDRFLESPKHAFGQPTTSLAVYNIHSWWERTRSCEADMCALNTNLTLAESEESKVRYGQLFDCSFKSFDGWSTTHNASSVQRVYIESNFSREELHEARNFSSLIKAASYVASDCHKRDSANANRDGVIYQIRAEGFRVDGLGRCMHSIGPEGIELSKSRDTRYNLQMKRDVIGHFMFNMAFENSLEPGYTTEKPFDAMMGGMHSSLFYGVRVFYGIVCVGTVPVYLGDSDHLKSLLPHPKAAIFVSDFPNITALVQYLTYLTKNETAYEEHRNWRYNYTVEKNIQNKPLLRDSWFCRICQWAVNQTRLTPAQRNPQRTQCVIDPVAAAAAAAEASKKEAPVKASEELNGKAVRGKNSRQVYLVKNGVLHAVPDLATFNSLNLELEKIVVIEDYDMKKLLYGEPLHKHSG